MVRKEVVVKEIEKIMGNIEQVRNIAIVAHVDHGNWSWINLNQPQP